MIPDPHGCQFNKSNCEKEFIKVGFTKEQAESLAKYFNQLYKYAKE